MKHKPPSKLVHEFIDLAHSDLNIDKLAKMLEEHPGLLTAPRPGKDKETALGAATHSRALAVMEFLLQRGAEMDVFAACVFDQHQLVADYLQAQPRLIKARAKHAHKCDLMDLAGSEQMVQLLLSRGFPMNIHVAASKGMLAQVQQFLQQDPASLEARDKEDATPLFSAIWSGQDEVALFLLGEGADPDVDGAGGRPLSYACCWGRKRVCRALIDLGADLSYVGFFYGFTHLHACCYWGEQGMGELSRSRYTEEILTVMRWLIEAGIQTQALDNEGRTAYRLALEKGFQQRAELLSPLS